MQNKKANIKEAEKQGAQESRDANNSNLLRKLYTVTNKDMAYGIAKSIAELYSSGSEEAALSIAGYILKLDWTNRKHDLNYWTDKYMKEFGDESFQLAIEKLKRELRGGSVVKRGELVIHYGQKGQGIELLVTLGGKPFIEKVSQTEWHVHSHSERNLWYAVIFNNGTPICACRDFKYRKNTVGGKCKHIYAVEATKALLQAAMEK